MTRTQSRVLLLLAGLAAACGSRRDTAPPLATPSVTINVPRAALGSPVEMTYKWVVAPGATFDQDYRVLVHFLDADEEMMWTDDHQPPTPTSAWKAGETIQYTRTMFVPVYPYIGRATVQVGLYSLRDGWRAPLAGQDNGQRAYTVAELQLLPQTENVFVIFKEGWHSAEVAEDNPAIEWQWTKKEAVLAFRNPKRDCLFYLNLEGQPAGLPDPQMLTVRIGDLVIDSFSVGRDQILKKIPITRAQLGTGEMVEIRLQVDKTVIPAQRPEAKSRDPRELGVRVFHAFIEPQG